MLPEKLLNSLIEKIEHIEDTPEQEIVKARDVLKETFPEVPLHEVNYETFNIWISNINEKSLKFSDKHRTVLYHSFMRSLNTYLNESIPELAKLQDVDEIIALIIESFLNGNNGNTKSFFEKIMSLVVVPTQSYTGYRYVILKGEGDEDEHRSVQLDWNRLQEPFQSYSKSQDGADAYLRANARSDSFSILIESHIEGFILENFAQEMIKMGDDLVNILKETSYEYFKVKSVIEEFEHKKETLLLELKGYGDQEEIVATVVHDYSFIGEKVKIS